MERKILLSCGICSSLLYLVTLLLGAMLWTDYSSRTQTVSELFALGAPTRPLVASLLVGYSLLVIAFGVGVWQSAGPSRALRVAASGLIGKEVLGAAATVVFPMHLRGAATSLTDTMHASLTLVGVLCILLAVAAGAVAFGTWFRRYSLLTIVFLVGGGVLAGMDGPRIGANLPTPWAGVTERINIFAFLLWVAVLALTLLRASVEGRSNDRGSTGEVVATQRAYR